MPRKKTIKAERKPQAQEPPVHEMVALRTPYYKPISKMELYKMLASGKSSIDAHRAKPKTALDKWGSVENIVGPVGQIWQDPEE